MREFQDKKRYRKYIYSRTSLVLLGIAILFFANATWGVYKKSRESAANAFRAENELRRLTDRENLLHNELERLNTDEGIEAEIRSKYSVSKPGENVIVIIDKDKSTTTVEAIPEGWWGKFKKLFK